MTGPGPHDLDYLCEHVRIALATDGRVSEQGIEVTVVGDTIVLAGLVASTTLRTAIGDVAGDVAPAGMVVVNDVEVSPADAPDKVEEIG
jgi:osmotically-inducible protein OsmY